MNARTRQWTLDKAGLYYEALLGDGRPEEAQAVARSVAEFDGTADTFLMLARHAWRAGARPVAQDLIDQALTAAPTAPARRKIHDEWTRIVTGKKRGLLDWW